MAGVPDVLDFPRDIQPILDALCVNCHGYERTAAGGPWAGRLILSGDRGPMFSHSYYMLTIAHLFSDGRNQARSNYKPRALGSWRAGSWVLWTARITAPRPPPPSSNCSSSGFETGAAYPGTYAALGTGMIGAYAENNQVETDLAWPSTQAGAEVLARRCAPCHNTPSRLLPASLSDERGVSFWQPSLSDPRLNTSRHIVFNLSRPEKSLLLLAPLAEAGGGWGLCRDPKSNEKAAVFAGAQDPGYQALLAMCVAGKERLRRIKRFDMPDFRPRKDWVREMVRFGILAPGDLAPDRPMNVYAVERKYWQSLWYQPR